MPLFRIPFIFISCSSLWPGAFLPSSRHASRPGNCRIHCRSFNHIPIGHVAFKKRPWAHVSDGSGSSATRLFRSSASFKTGPTPWRTGSSISGPIGIYIMLAWETDFIVLTRNSNKFLPAGLFAGDHRHFNDSLLAADRFLAEQHRPV